MIVHVTKTHRIRKLCDVGVGVGGLCNTFACVNCSVADRGSADKCSKMALFKQKFNFFLFCFFFEKTPMDFYQKSGEDETSASCLLTVEHYSAEVNLIFTVGR